MLLVSRLTVPSFDLFDVSLDVLRDRHFSFLQHFLHLLNNFTRVQHRAAELVFEQPVINSLFDYNIWSHITMCSFASPAYSILPVRFRYSAGVATGRDTRLLAFFFLLLFIQQLSIPMCGRTEPDISLVANFITVRTPFGAFLHLRTALAGTGTGFAFLRHTHFYIPPLFEKTFDIKQSPRHNPNFRKVLGLCLLIQLLIRCLAN